jgi:hypothetical protein
MNTSLFRFISFLPAFFLFLSCTTFHALPKDGTLSPEEIQQACSIKQNLPEFGNEFSVILTLLITDSWKEDGDWIGDLQGDATFFAPVILYDLWRDTENPVFRKMADRTVDHEKSLVRRFSLFPVPGMEMVIGFPVLAEAYKATGDLDSLDRYLSGVKKGSALASFYPGFFTPFVYDKSSVYGTIGTMTLQAYELTMDESFRKRGLDLIAAADHSCWNAEEGLYSYEELADWPQATMLIALVKAYRITGDMGYLERCKTIIRSMDERFLDRQKGGYYGHPAEMTKGLSGNNTLAWAFLDLFEATGDRMYLERAGSLLKWILSEDLCDKKTGIIYHHWDNKSGRSGIYCSGCNFHTLCIIHRYNRLKYSLQPASS